MVSTITRYPFLFSILEAEECAGIIEHGKSGLFGRAVSPEQEREECTGCSRW